VARFPFKLPDIGEGIAEAEIVGWHVKVGDMVEEDAPLADLMTDKATVEMSAPVAGKVVELAGAVGDQVAIGSVLAVFETEDGEEPAEDKPRPFVSSPSTACQGRRSGQARAETSAQVGKPVSTSLDTNGGGGRVLASPAVRARAKDLGIDLAAVRPAGNRIRHADLDALLRYSGGQGRSADRVEEVKVTGLRRRIAENMQASKRNIPHFSYVEEVDVTAIEALRAALNAERGDRPKLSLLPFLIVAICRSIPDFPMINARYDDEAGIVARHGAVHLGVATQTDGGLAVPVIHDAHRLDLWALAVEIIRLADAARGGKASREELAGSTITITSLGALGGIVSTPVINRPEVAIVGVNRIVERPAVIEGRIEVRKLMNLSSSFDHRVVDGWDAARFIQAVKRLVEMPALLFVDDRS
jgi:2-oxoisovalerate dehydrogenase E2 component (dihydrolipoyl transacylase)